VKRGANVRSNVDDLGPLEPTEEDKLTMMCNRAFSAERLAEQNNALLNAATSCFVTDELIEQTRAAMAAGHTSYKAKTQTNYWAQLHDRILTNLTVKRAAQG